MEGMKKDFENMSKASRDKGARGERMFANDLFDLTGIRVRRNLTQYQAVNGCDLVPDYDNNTALENSLVANLSFEVKNYAKVTHGDLVRFWIQCREQTAKNGKTPVLAVKASRQPWVIYIPCGDEMSGTGFEWTIGMSIELFCAKVSNGEFKQ